MADSRWRIADGEWQIANGEWQIAISCKGVNS
jgi:hypothetical protein